MADARDPFYDPPIMTPEEVYEFMKNLDETIPKATDPRDAGGRAHVMARMLVIEQHRRTLAWTKEKKS